MAQEFGNVGVRSEDNNENLTECPDRVDAKKMLFKWIQILLKINAITYIRHKLKQ